MRLTTSCCQVLFTLSIFAISCSTAQPFTTAIGQTARGIYVNYGTHTSDNYFVGKFDQTNYRNYFVFDLSGISQPISSATLALECRGFSSYATSENYELHDITTPISELLADGTSIAVYNDLGSGVVYGNRLITAADIDTIVAVQLNAAAINALNSSHGLVGMGGSLTTINNGSLIPQYAFGYSYTGGLTELRLTLVPEPSSGLLCLLGMLGVQLRRRTSTFHIRV